MENRINQIVELDNGKKYFIIKQAVYAGNTYFIVAETNDTEDDVKENFAVLREVKENDESYIEYVNDSKILETLLKHIDI